MLGVGADVLLTQPKMQTLTAAEKRAPKTTRSAGFQENGKKPRNRGVWREAQSGRKSENPRQAWGPTGLFRSKERLFAEGLWWSWGDLNPRPQAIFEQIYMFSGLI